MKKQKLKKQEYYSKRMPKFFQESFQDEQKALTEQLLETYQEALLKLDFQDLRFRVRPLLERVSKVYGLDNKSKLFILTTSINFLIEKNGLQTSQIDQIIFFLKYSIKGKISFTLSPAERLREMECACPVSGPLRRPY